MQKWVQTGNATKYGVWMENQKNRWGRRYQWFRQSLETRFGKYLFSLCMIGFLLGRASVLGELTPFALSFYAVMLRVRKRHTWMVMAFIVAGVVSSDSLRHLWPVLCITLLIYRIIYGILYKQQVLDPNAVPFIVFLVDAGIRVGYAGWIGDLSRYSVIMALVDGFLATVLTYIFVQTMPILTFQKTVKQLRNEEIICLVIVLASLLTGFEGLRYHQLSIENIFSRYLIMLFALIGGAGIGSGVGVVIGIILTLGNLGATTQIGLLAFSGVLAGLLKDGNKWGVGIGAVLGSAILTVYVADLAEVWIGMLETACAFLALLFTPKTFLEKVARFVPGTHQFRLSQQDYARRVRDLMAGRIREVSNVFNELSRSFMQLTSTVLQPQDEQLHRTLQRAAQSSCLGCTKQTHCWDKEFYQTYRALFDMLTSIEEKGTMDEQEHAQFWRNKCVRPEQVKAALYDAVEAAQQEIHWRNQIFESRNLVASQLEGVSRIMSELVEEIKKENHISADHEEHIMAALEQLGMTVQSVDIISLEEGKVEIEVTQMETVDARSQCEKVVAPLLSEIIGETITVSNKDTCYQGGYVTFRLSSARNYQVVTGVANAAKDGRVVSGDSFTTLDIGNGKFALAVSDGMGNGERAMQESSAAIRLLQQLLKAGFDEQLALKTVNSTLVLRSKDEVFATMDLALIDLYSAQAKMVKIGSAPSFIKRGNQVRTIRGANVPIGVFLDVEFQTVEEELQQGDLLILVSDGIYDAPKHVYDKEDWLRRRIEQLETNEPQEIADMLVELAVRINHGQIIDDMTVVVARLDAFQPEWATIRLPGVGKLKRGPQVHPYFHAKGEDFVQV
jgi:stage II sporulation protein E